MLGLDSGVKARRIVDQLTAEMGDKLTKDQLIALVAKVQRGEGTEEEIHACLTLVGRNVPIPTVSDLIYYSDPGLSAEEVIERAFAYRPIILGPATEF